MPCCLFQTVRAHPKQRTTTSTTKVRERVGNESMLAPEDENEADVRREDQDRINQFARLNARRHDNTMERDQIKVQNIYTIVGVCLCMWCVFMYVCVCAIYVM
jgi:hypothetical protein